MRKPVLAVVVTFNPDLNALTRTLSILNGQQSDVLVVDNGSSNFVKIRAKLTTSTEVELLPLNANLGLGAAHNAGIRFARTKGYEYVLLMDQDSIPLDHMVQRLLEAHRAKSTHQKLSAVGVTYLNADNGSESFFVRFGWLKFQRHYCAERDSDGCVLADFLISSGSLISLATLEKVGEMDEGLFIDHVDTEWFLRARNLGYHAFGVCDAVMQHGLGEQTHRVTLGRRQRNVPQHKPFRYYYIFRNSVLLYRRAYASGVWKWNDLQRLAMIAVMFGLLKSPRRANLTMMLRGFWHGIRGVTGPYSDA
ncbi:rhamnosyltransferase [Arenicella chitinivorans]|uniref:Rhamnosyltransferase n=1 Tax=Arenicella chitinivorans TaxID=1329800 RepID=A0A918RZ55_9GAMM|nr:glycosyltransferase family 2 protein [Arenicella chitinivorans]GHA16986.1 rhamnosyltransferase [Arenicella chitinivorans]